MTVQSCTQKHLIVPLARGQDLECLRGSVNLFLLLSVGAGQFTVATDWTLKVSISFSLHCLWLITQECQSPASLCTYTIHICVYSANWSWAETQQQPVKVVLYAVDKGLCSWNVLHQLLLRPVAFLLTISSPNINNVAMSLYYIMCI